MKNLRQLFAVLLVLGLLAAACTADDTAPTTDGDTTETTQGSGDTTTETTAPSTDSTTADPGDVAAQADGSTLDEVRARGVLKCGVSGSAVAFSETQSDGSMTGFDADLCRAVAAAVLGDATAVEFSALTAAERFTALSSGEIDVLIRNTTWTQSRDTTLGLDFGPTTYYDGQGVMGKASDGFTADSTLADVDGAVLCTNAGTTTEKNISEGAALAGATITLSTVETFPEAMEGFKSGSCDLVTTDASGLVGNLVTAIRDGAIAEGDWVVFPRAPISKEPLGPVYRQNDSQWGDIINWTAYATMIADEKGADSGNIDALLADADLDPELARLFGVDDGELQTSMGLAADAFYQVVKQVGNYGEIFDANLNPVGLFRDGTPNAQWSEGGLIYAPPAR